MATTTARQRDEHSDLADENLGKLVPESEPIILTARDWEVFLAEWKNPSPPSPRLEEAVRRYRSRRQPDVG